MASKEKRFEVVYKEESQLSSEGLRMVMIDWLTGVNYLMWSVGEGAAITPLVDPEGKPLASMIDNFLPLDN